MAVPLSVGSRQCPATIVAAALAKVELLDEAIAWRQLAPYSRVLQEQVDRLRQHRESLLAALDALRRCLGEPVTRAGHLSALPSPRLEPAPRPRPRSEPVPGRELPSGPQTPHRWWAAA